MLFKFELSAKGFYKSVIYRSKARSLKSDTLKKELEQWAYDNVKYFELVAPFDFTAFKLD